MNQALSGTGIATCHWCHTARLCRPFAPGAHWVCASCRRETRAHAPRCWHCAGETGLRCERRHYWICDPCQALRRADSVFRVWMRAEDAAAINAAYAALDAAGERQRRHRRIT